MRAALLKLLMLSLSLGLLACGDLEELAGGSPIDPSTPGVITPGTPDTPVPPETTGGPETPETPEELVIYNAEPDEGRTVGGELVVLLGDGFEDGMDVWFGSRAAQEVIVHSPLVAHIRTPSHTPGVVDLTVRLVGGESKTVESGFVFRDPLDAKTIEPTAGPAHGGTPFTVRGLGFTADTRVLFDGRLAIDATVVDSQTILGITPPGEGGPIDVLVANALAQDTLKDGFAFDAPPTVLAMSPASGPWDDETVVHLDGLGLTEDVVVTIGGNPTTLVAASGSAMKVRVAGGPLGPADVVLTGLYGETILPDAFTFTEAAVGNVIEVVNVFPASGTSEGGDSVAITAYGLTTKADTTVTFGGADAEVLDVHPGEHRILVRTPAGTAGDVATITVQNMTGSSSLQGAWSWMGGPELVGVHPAAGPMSGGTTLTVSGYHLDGELDVYVGALPAVVLEASPTKLMVVSPPGSPGLADVRVVGPGVSDILPAAFEYEAEGGPEVYAIVPSYGAIAGNTLVHVYGAGFDSTAEVLFAKKGVMIESVTATEIRLRSLKADEPTTVDITVRQGSFEHVKPDGFSYFDPAAPYGGAWGAEIDGTVNITVLDLYSTDPIVKAFVMLGSDPGTKFQGLTDERGQVTFSDPDIFGAQMVTASKLEYTAYSVVEYDAENVTVHLIPYSPSSSGGGGGGPEELPLGELAGKVTGLGKYVLVPPQTCDYMAGKGLAGADGTSSCLTCEASADCGASSSARCILVASEGPYCIEGCSVDADCADRYVCSKASDGANGCIPDPGYKSAYCQATHFELWEEPLQPHSPKNTNGRAWIDEDDTYWMKTRLGQLAVICTGGVVRDPNPSQKDSSFEPLVLGVVRHIDPIPGERIEGIDVALNIPLDRDIPIRLVDAPLTYENPGNGVEGPTKVQVQVALDFASDGYWNVMTANESGVDTFVLARQPRSLSGPLDDVTYAFLALVEGVGNQLAVSGSQAYKVKALEVDRLFNRVDGAWQPVAAGIPRDIHGLWGSTSTSVWAVGAGGLIAHGLGNAWFPQYSPTTHDLHSVWGSALDHAVAVGDAGTVLVFDGAVWTPEVTPTTTDLRAVWGSALDNMYAVGEGVALRRGASGWTAMSGAPAATLRAAWSPTPTALWAVGDDGALWRWGAGQWTSTPLADGIALRGLSGRGPDDVWIVGDLGTVIHWTGEGEFTQLDVPTLARLNAVHADPTSDDVVVVGDRGALLVWDGQGWQHQIAPSYGGDLLATWATGVAEAGTVAAGTQVASIGPMLSFPVITKPTAPMIGQSPEFEYKLVWEAEPGTLPTFNFIEMLGGPGNYFPVWWTVVDAQTQDIEYPNLPLNKGITPFLPGFHMLMVHRVLKPGSTVDNFDFWDTYFRSEWSSWATAGVPIYP